MDDYRTPDIARNQSEVTEQYANSDGSKGLSRTFIKVGKAVK